MQEAQYRYTFSNQDVVDGWSYIQFTPANGYNAQYPVVSHLAIQPCQVVRPVWIRHISAIINRLTVQPTTPEAALYLAVFLAPNTVSRTVYHELALPILQGTQGATNYLFANFPRSLYCARGIIVYISSTAGLTAGDSTLTVNAIIENAEDKS